MRAVTVPGSKKPVTPFRRSNSSPPLRVTVYQISLNVKVTDSKGISIALDSVTSELFRVAYSVSSGMMGGGGGVGSTRR